MIVSTINIAMPDLSWWQNTVKDERILHFLLVAALLIAFPLLLRVLNYALVNIKGFLKPYQQRWVRPIRIKNFEFISGTQITRIYEVFLKLLGVSIMLGFSYIYLAIAFSLLPQTRQWSNVLISVVTSNALLVWLAVVGYLPKLASIIVVSLLLWGVLRLIKTVFRAIAAEQITLQGFYPEWAEPTQKIMTTLVLALGMIFVFPLLPGFDSPAFKGISVFLGVLLSLGSSSAVANVVAGMVLIYMRAFRTGDRIETNGIRGDVIEKTLLLTRIRTVKNVEVTLPNSMILNNQTLNYSRTAETGGLILHTAVTIGYDVPWVQIHQLLKTAASRTENILASPEPFVLQTALEDFYVRYELNAYTDSPHRMERTTSQLHLNIQDTFAEAGVEIMSPHYRALRDGNEVAIPQAVLT